VIAVSAQDLLSKRSESAAIGWTAEEAFRSRMKVIAKRVLRKFGNQPDRKASAAETILKEEELLAGAWAAS